MTDTQPLSQWQHLANEAQAGRLTLDPSVARECLAACDELIAGFEDITALSRFAQHAQGFGGFDSGNELSAMYGRKGAGGPDAIDRIIREHKVVVGLIRDTISASVAKVGSQDDTNAQGISGIQPR